MQVPGMSHTQILFLHLQCVSPVVEGCSGQDYGVVVGPLGGVPPSVLQGVPEVAPGGVTHDAVREATPHQEGKVHLQGAELTHLTVYCWDQYDWLLDAIDTHMNVMTTQHQTYFTCQQDCVFIQTQHCVCLYGGIRQKPAGCLGEERRRGGERDRERETDIERERERVVNFSNVIKLAS